MRALVYGDIHLDTGADRRPFERPDLDPAEWDVVITLGDVVHRTREDFDDPSHGDPYEERGRAFFEHLDAADVPVVAVPGNHDPLNATRRLVDDLDGVVVAHRRVVTDEDVPAVDADWDGVSFAGVGCEQFDQGPELAYLDVPSLDPRTATDGRSVHERATAWRERIESAVGTYLSGAHDVDDAVDALEPAPEDRPVVLEQLETLAEKFSVWRDLLAASRGSTVALSHVSPFGVAFDSHHGDDDWSLYPTGSIAFKMALYDAAPLAAFSGHTHVGGTDVVQGAGGTTYAYNPGEAVVEVTIRPDRGQVQPTDPSV
jgi:Icc-related predicted phosphoesterase